MLVVIQHAAIASPPPPLAEHAIVSIRVFKVAEQPAGTLTVAEQVASHVFAMARISVIWEEGDPNIDDARSVDQSASCADFLRSTELKLRIIPAVPGNLLRAALGMALPCATFGPQATIFSNRIEAAAHAFAVSSGQALGYAMAHEIGHVLLHSNDHSPSGIMRAVWGAAEWKAVAAGTLAFTSEEGDRMLRIIRAVMR